MRPLNDLTICSGAEGYFNLFTVRKNTDATSDEERARLEVVGEYHLGDMVNRYAPHRPLEPPMAALHPVYPVA